LDALSGRRQPGGSISAAAWEKTSGAGRTYYSVRLDDPTFTAPVFASLIEQDEGGYALIWSRLPQRRD
jgi:uncharacterized protein (DUF736 family)